MSARASAPSCRSEPDGFSKFDLHVAQWRAARRNGLIRSMDEQRFVAGRFFFTILDKDDIYSILVDYLLLNVTKLLLTLRYSTISYLRLSFFHRPLLLFAKIYLVGFYFHS